MGDQAKASAGKTITENNKSYGALLDAEPLDYRHCLERELIYLLLPKEIDKGLADVEIRALTRCQRGTYRFEAYFEVFVRGCWFVLNRGWARRGCQI
jgi:hypothetical protein